MNWNNAKTHPPDNTNDVLVSDGFGSYAVAWYQPNSKIWHAALDMLDADNYDGGCHIAIDSGEIRFWVGIDE